MVIGILHIHLFMAENQSLKDKRRILKSLKARMRNNFNVAVSEMDHHEKWQRALIGAVSICNEKKVMDAMFSDIIKFVDRDRGVEITKYSTEFL